MPRKVSKVTLQGLKNAGTLADWKLLHGDKSCRIYSKEWNSWWRANGCGYHSSKDSAGIYTLKEAFSYSAHCGPEKKIEYHFVEPFYAKSRQ